MFTLLEEARKEESQREPGLEDCYSDVSNAKFHGFSHLIRPAMLLNIYSFVEFWLPEVCDYKHRKLNLVLQHKDIKGDNDIHAYHKYLTKYAKLDLSNVRNSYNQLQYLRKIRNSFIHNGGHIPEEKQSEFDGLEEVYFSGTLIVIEDQFIWSCIDHASCYLKTAISANN